MTELRLGETRVAVRAPQAEAEDSRSSVAKRDVIAGPPDEWRDRLRQAIAEGPIPVHLVGVGNRFRTDDAVGLEIVSVLRSRLGAYPVRGVRVHRVSPMPERILSNISSEAGSIVIFDAVEASKEPGEVVFCKLADTKYGFFGTHNVPLKLIPGLSTRDDDVYLVGVQPASLEVGEGLTDTVQRSVREVITTVTEGVVRRS